MVPCRGTKAGQTIILIKSIEYKTTVSAMITPKHWLHFICFKRPIFTDIRVYVCICLPVSHLGLPHEPELKDVDVSTTLDRFVSRVVGDVILFVWLEQVAGTHGVTAC